MRTMALLLAACGGGGSSPDAAARTCTVAETPSCTEAAKHSDLAWIEAHIFITQCSFAGCHDGQATVAGRLDLKTPGMSHGELVNVDSVLVPGRTLVVPGQPKQSYLMMIMQLFPPAEMEPTPVGPPPNNTGFMPQNTNNVPVCCQKLDALERWIATGALAN